MNKGCNEPEADPNPVGDKNALQNLKKEILLNPERKDSILQIISDWEVDSLKTKAVFGISYEFYKNRDSLNFRYWNRKSMEVSVALKDTSRIAEANWDLANFFYKENILDSSYYYYNIAFEQYESIDDDFQAGRMLLNMATIQTNIKDYVGSEVTTIKAIEKISPFNKYHQLYLAYNNLGIIRNHLKDFKNSINFHSQALQYAIELKDDYLIALSYNNIGVVRKNMGQYSKAIKDYLRASSITELDRKYPELKAMLIDNISFARLKLKDTIHLEEEFFKAIKIREEVEHVAGIAVSNLHLGQFYLFNGDTLKAFKHFSNAQKIAGEHNLNKEFLESLLYLSKIDEVHSQEYLNKYIKLTDEFQQNERALQNKFARIRFETDEFIEANEQLTEEKKWMIVGFSGLAITLVFLLAFFKQKAKYRELKLIQDQQNSNEEIYNLLITSKEKLEEGQDKERKRISRDLHDGILSQFFGIRLNLEFLNDKKDKNSVEKREKFIKELRVLENEIREVSHQLNNDSFNSEQSFLKIVEDLLLQQEQISQFTGNIIVNEVIEWEKLNPKLKINLYRIIQEALHNINKHSGASEVKIEFQKKEGELIINIKDNGSGFNISKGTEGIGIKNIKSRTKELKGKIFFNSNKKGTLITVVIPIYINKWKK